jgi:hypothetical protein
MKQVEQVGVFAWRFRREGEFVFDSSSGAVFWHRWPSAQGTQSFELADPETVPDDGWEHRRGCDCRFCSQGQPDVALSKELQHEDR